MAKVLEDLRRRAANRPRRILFPESNDPRVIEAAQMLLANGWAQPVLLGPVEDHQAIGFPIEVAATDDPDLRGRCIERLVELRQHKGMTPERAAEAIDDRLMLAALMVSLGDVDACVAGSIATTAAVLRAAIYGVGLKPDCALVSSFFLMDWVDRCLTFADCAVVPDPDAQQLAEIAISSAENHERLTGVAGKIAMLSFSSLGSADHPSAKKMAAAVELIRQQRPDLAVDGELQFDAALVPDVGRRKAPASPVAGDANVLIFPDLNAGNIGYKIAERLGGIAAIGPILQGLRAPCMDLSRGCKSSDIADVAVVASLMS